MQHNITTAMATKTTISLLVLLLAALVQADACDIVDSWRGFNAVTHTSSGNVGGTGEFVFTNNATFSGSAEIVMGDDCKFGQSYSGTYTFANGTYLSLTYTECAYVNCDDECSSFCLFPCTPPSEPRETEISFAGDCNSFTTTDSNITYWREGAYWWIWFIIAVLILCTCCCCCCCCVACVACCCVGVVKIASPSKTEVQLDLEAAPHINYGATDGMY